MSIQNIKKALNLICYYLIPLGLIITSFVISEKSANAFYGNLGTIAAVLLGFILFVKPLSQIFYKIRKLSIIVAFRRQLGVACFWFSLFHGVLYIRYYELYTPQSFSEKLYLFGLVGLIGMTILGLTSNNLSTKILKRHWKTLHRIVYLVFVAVLLHYVQAEGEVVGPVLIGTAFFVLKLLAWRGVTLPKKQNTTQNSA